MVNDITSKEHLVSYEDALSETSTQKARSNPRRKLTYIILLLEFGKFNYILIFVSGLVVAYPPVESFTIGYVIPMAQCDFGLTSADKGLLNAMVLTGIISSAYLWGFLADKIGRRKTIMAALFLASITSALSSFASNFVLFLICRYFTGFFISGACPIIIVYLGEFHRTNARSRVIMVASFIYSLLFTVLPLLAWLIINQTWTLDISFLDVTYKPWRLFILVGCLPGLFSGCCFLKLPESPKFLLAAGKNDECIKILKGIYSFNTGMSKDTYKIQAIKAEDEDMVMYSKTQGSSIFRLAWTQTLELFSRKYVRKTLLVCTMQFCILLTGSGMYVWFRDILNQVMIHLENNPDSTNSICEIVHLFTQNATTDKNDENCITQLEIGTYTYSLLLETMYTIGFITMGFIIKAVGKRIILISLLGVCAPCGIAAALVYQPMGAIYLYMIFLLSANCITVVHSITIELFPTQIRAMAICMSLIVGRAGSITGTNMIGLLIDTKCESTFMITASALIICAFLTYLIPLKKTEETKFKNYN